jgi:SAM-dependent methyltransferase
LNSLRELFTRESRVLELGGGDGYQAKVISDLGCSVDSIDIQIPETDPVYPVRKYDGVNIPFEASHFDIVYSSNVLQHVEHLPDLLAETKRVMTQNGKAIHTLPSTAWRFWTSLCQLPYSAEKLRQRKYSPAYALRQAFSIRPQGRFPNAIAELYYFGRTYWKSVFAKAGFSVTSVLANGIFYTGQMMYEISVPTREKLARFLGSASNVYVLKKTFI